VCVCVCLCARDIYQVFHTLISVWPTYSGCTGDYSATARRAAVTRVRGGANLNCSRDDLQKLVVAQMVKKLAALFGTRHFIVFTRALTGISSQLVESSLHPHPSSLKLILILSPICV
jgi:hypothetical protein